MNLFTPPKNKYLSKIITIKSYSLFIKSVKLLSSKKNYNLSVYRALVLAQNRAKALLNRKNLSREVRSELVKITKFNIPKPKRWKIWEV